MAFCSSALYATYRILFIALVTCLPTYRTMARYFEFLSKCYGFHLTHLRMMPGLCVIRASKHYDRKELILCSDWRWDPQQESRKYLSIFPLAAYNSVAYKYVFWWVIPEVCRCCTHEQAALSFSDSQSSSSQYSCSHSYMFSIWKLNYTLLYLSATCGGRGGEHAFFTLGLTVIFKISCLYPRKEFHLGLSLEKYAKWAAMSPWMMLEKEASLTLLPGINSSHPCHSLLL
jgi:hypothetical protein